MRKNNKGFTLIELLAVIVILGLLMAIAIPSVTRYITQSRRKTVVTSIDSYVTSVMTEVNDGEYHFSDATKVYAVPIECVSLEKGGTNPFGNWMQANTNYWAYVLVQYDSENYNYVYGFTFKDDAGYGMYPTSHANIDEGGSQIKTGYNFNQPKSGLAKDFVTANNWQGFNITNDTDLVVLEAGSEGVPGNGETTCTLCQKGDNYEQVEQEKIESKKLVNLIKNNNKIITTAPNLKAINGANEKGLFSSNQTTNGSATYYFRGNVINNYVSFAGQTWRIVRINEDGTIRLIMQSGINGKTYTFNSTHNTYGVMYYSNGSNAKQELETWYSNNLKDYDEYIVVGTFCEQAKVKYLTSYTSGNATMAVYTNYIPSFDCDPDGNDKGVLESNVGLITIDEVIHAGGYFFKSNSNYYLYNGKYFWTMSPAGFASNYARVWYVNLYASESMYNNGVNTYNSLRPVINLNANVTAIGTGTSDDPYIIQTN